MRRYSEACYASVIRMSRSIEVIQEKIFDCTAAEFTGRKTDRVDHEKIDRNPGRSIVAIRRGEKRDIAMSEPARIDADFSRLSFLRQARL